MNPTIRKELTMARKSVIEKNFKGVLTKGEFDWDKVARLGESEKSFLIYNLYLYELNKFESRSQALKGKPKSEEHKRKIAESMKGNKNALKQPAQVIEITYNPKYADCWTILLENSEDEYETITASDNPGYPQGVWSSESGSYIDENDEKKTWNDLPETLQKYIEDYINVERS
jgi:hypothetical protein